MTKLALAGDLGQSVGWWETRWTLDHNGYLVPQIIWVQPIIHFVGRGY